MTKTVTLTQIARDLKMSPKMARRIARNNPKAFGKSKAPWVFPVTARKKIASALQGA